MTLEEAIDLGKAAADDMALQDMPRFAEAVKLGIEALKTILRWRQQHRDYGVILLPGETEE